MIEFEYNGKIYYADKLDKKLKKLKINKEDIKILNDNFQFIRKDKHLESEFEDYTFAYILDKITNHTHQCLWDDISVKPNILDLMKNNIWNGETKTGINGITIDYVLNNMILLNGIPKYPINRIGDTCELIKEYNWN